MNKKHDNFVFFKKHDLEVIVSLGTLFVYKVSKHKSFINEQGAPTMYDQHFLMRIQKKYISIP